MDRLAASAAILVGGRSRRFLSDKAFMPLGETTVAQSLFERLFPVFAEVFFVADRKDKLAGYESATVADLLPGLGPLGGLQTALYHTAHEYCFVTACDLPFLDARLVELLWEQRGAADVIVPRAMGRAHPAAALYHRRCRVAVDSALAEGRYSMRSFWAEANVVPVDLAEHFSRSYVEKVLLNVNTPEDYWQMLSLAECA